MRSSYSVLERRRRSLSARIAAWLRSLPFFPVPELRRPRFEEPADLRAREALRAKRRRSIAAARKAGIKFDGRQKPLIRSPDAINDERH